MKIFVFTDPHGEVVGTYRPTPEAGAQAPRFTPVADPKSGHHVHEIDAPDHLSDAAADVLHREVAKLIGKTKA